jgi:hypothetical protein
MDLHTLPRTMDFGEISGLKNVWMALSALYPTIPIFSLIQRQGTRIYWQTIGESKWGK